MNNRKLNNRKIIGNFQETVEDKRLLPIYVQVHHNFKYQLAMEHLVNQLSTRSELGNYIN